MTTIHRFIARYTNQAPGLHVGSAVKLAALNINPFDRYYSLPQALDEAFGIELSDDEIASWLIVRDVERDVIALTGVKVR